MSANRPVFTTLPATASEPFLAQMIEVIRQIFAFLIRLIFGIRPVEFL